MNVLCQNLYVYFHCQGSSVFKISMSVIIGRKCIILANKIITIHVNVHVHVCVQYLESHEDGEDVRDKDEGLVESEDSDYPGDAHDEQQRHRHLQPVSAEWEGGGAMWEGGGESGYSVGI